MSKDIWVYLETNGDELLEGSLECICEGRRLADQVEGELVTILTGFQVEKTTGIPFQYGADKMFWLDDPRLERYAPEMLTAVITGLVNEYNPSIFLFSASSRGNDLAARLAARLKTGLSVNCDKLHFDSEGFLVQRRLCFQRKANATFVCRKTCSQLATVESGVMKIVKTERSGAVVQDNNVRFLLDDYFFGGERVKTHDFVSADPQTIDISDAELIVSGGKGVGDLESFKIIRELAAVLKAAVAGSRAAVDNGCIEQDRQIGQSGKTVAPELLISCGVSGANAHTVGMRETKTLVAINKSKSAPMIKRADLGVVGDLHEIIPHLIEMIKQKV